MLYDLTTARAIKKSFKSLNPYFFGKCSTTHENMFCKDGLSLNPYFFGKCSTTFITKRLNRPEPPQS